METIRRISAFLGPSAVLIALACGISCGASQTQSASTSPASSPASNEEGDNCIHHGMSCSRDNDCCTLWCANSVCTRKSP
jgi:hypothetical protein